MAEDQRAELSNLVELDVDALYRLLVSEEDPAVYSKEGATARGKEIFSRVFPEVRNRVCSAYVSRQTTIDHSVDMAALVSAAIVGVPMLIGVPLLPLSALIVKIGLDQLCRDFNPDEE